MPPPGGMTTGLDGAAAAGPPAATTTVTITAAVPRAAASRRKQLLGRSITIFPSPADELGRALLRVSPGRTHDKMSARNEPRPGHDQWSSAPLRRARISMLCAYLWL